MTDGDTPVCTRSPAGGAAGLMAVVILALLGLSLGACGDDSPLPSGPPADSGTGTDADREGEVVDGTIHVGAVTSGTRLDPDGYVVSVDGTLRGSIAPSGSTSISGMSDGEHSVSLSGVASNCRVTVPNPQTVTVGDPFGSPSASFYVYCS